MSYADHKYGVIERHWFGLTKKYGGDAASAFTVAAAAEATLMTRFYPRGPIRLLKFGGLCVATGGDGELMFVLNKESTRLGRIVGSTDSAPNIFSSVVLDDDIDAGTYLTITNSTNVCSTGSYAFFIDFRRISSSKWHPAS
jgi:hypothetical protein